MRQKIPGYGAYNELKPISEYWTSCFYLQLHSPGHIIHTNVPPQIEDAVKKVQKRWNIDIPCSKLDDLSHGDLGHIFFLAQEKGYDEENSKRKAMSGTGTYRIFARVSYGAPHIKEKKDRTDWDMKDFHRLHLGVLGTKFFRPEDDSQRVIRENLYLTLRWGAGESLEFEDQSTAFLQGKTHCFDERRMTFYQTQPWLERASKSYAIDTRSVIPKYTIEESETMLEDKEQRRKYDDLLEAHGDKVIPVVGYEPVLQALSRYGNVSVDDLSFFRSSTPLQGLEYFVDKAIPAMEAYVKAQPKKH